MSNVTHPSSDLTAIGDRLAFEMIPNLQVHKLKLHAFVGENWETSPEALPCLKLLKLSGRLW